jgi:putative transcriptional regulator
MNRIKQIRNDASMTLKELHDKTDLSIGYLANLELGHKKNPSRDVMGKIAKALGKTIVEVFFPEDESEVN